LHGYEIIAPQHCAEGFKECRHEAGQGERRQANII